MDIDCHPITGSNVRLVLFNIFHERNTKNTVESLCRIGCVTDLIRMFNSHSDGYRHDLLMHPINYKTSKIYIMILLVHGLKYDRLNL